jgi:hypothetical protein
VGFFKTFHVLDAIFSTSKLNFEVDFRYQTNKNIRHVPSEGSPQIDSTKEEIQCDMKEDKMNELHVRQECTTMLMNADDDTQGIHNGIRIH